MKDSPLNPPLTRKDFASDLAVRWCPGCGDFSILAQQVFHLRKYMEGVA